MDPHLTVPPKSPFTECVRFNFKCLRQADIPKASLHKDNQENELIPMNKRHSSKEVSHAALKSYVTAESQ